MSTPPQAFDIAHAAQVLVRDQFCIQAGETVIVTADTATDRAAIEAILAAAAGVGAKAMLILSAQLPYQGKLADPYIPDALASAAADSDAWFDMTFPYMAGSSAHDRAMKAGRTRYPDNRGEKPLRQAVEHIADVADERTAHGGRIYPTRF